MKKIYSYISVLALAAFSAGCAEELVSPEEMMPSDQEQIVGGEFTLTLSVPASADTKSLEQKRALHIRYIGVQKM